MRDGKILLGKRNNEPAKGKWWFFGGRLHKGETLEEGVKRKALEEIGASVKIIKQLTTKDTIFKEGPFGWSTHTVSVTYLVELIDEEINLDNQHNNYRWFDKEDEGLNWYVREVVGLG